MITELYLHNFKCFGRHTLGFKQRTIVVGANNAGKSTVIEALRLLAIITSRYRAISFRDVPSWLDLPKRTQGIIPSLKGMEFNFANLFNQYADPPALISAKFEGGEIIEVYLAGEDQIFAVIKDRDGNLIRTKGQANRVTLPKIGILPQIGPLPQRETILTEDYVRSCMSSSLSTLHFRNQINIFYDDLFNQFQEMAETTWPGFQIIGLDGHGGLPHSDLQFFVRDGSFVGEVACMGHGLQMWLQTMWFLVHTGQSTTIILDEPDVYMHADLQRKIIRLPQLKQKQIIIATHSIEIMSEVEADEILVVDRRQPRSSFARSLPAVQNIIDRIGGVHNVHLTRLWRSRRLLLVEGKDNKLLKLFQDILFPDNDEPFDIIPNMVIGGWGGWQYAIGSNMLLKNAGGEKITIYCILDSDYHTTEEIRVRYDQAYIHNVELHIWKRKEIENYIIIPSAINRLIIKNIPKRAQQPTIIEVTNQINRIAESLEEEAFDGLSNQFLAQDRSLGSAGANKHARELIKDKKKLKDGLLHLVSGKRLLSQLSHWSQTEFGVSLSSINILKTLTKEEIPSEVVYVVKAIHLGEPLKAKISTK